MSHLKNLVFLFPTIFFVRSLDIFLVTWPILLQFKEFRLVMNQTLFLANFAFLLSSCSFDERRTPKKSTATGSANVDSSQDAFSFLQKNLFKPTCEGCHSATRASGGVTLIQYDFVFSRRFDIVKAVASRRMPPNGSVDDSVVQNLKCWVSLGASTNLKASDIQEKSGKCQ